MEIANSMKGITEDIVASYDTRVRALGDLVVDTRKTLKGFATDRKKMAREQAESLANFTRGLSKSAEDMLKGFRKDHQQMSEEQAESLSNFVADLTKNVENMMKGIHKAHKEMADNLNESLEKGETDRLKSFKVMMGDINKDIKDIETYVANKLKEFSDAHADMSEQQKKDLAKFVSGMTSEVKRLLTGYGKDINGASHAWKGMAATLAKARKGGSVGMKVEAKESVTTVEEAVEKKVKAKRAVKAQGK